MLSRLLFWVACVVFPVSEVVLATVKRADPHAARVEDRGSLRLLWSVILISCVAASWVASSPWVRSVFSSSLPEGVALALLLVGLTLRWTSILMLGSLFTVDVAIHRDHTLVTTGPYQYVRHPSYTGLVLAFTGLGLVFGNWLSLVVLVAPITSAVVHRISIEESALHSALGEPYARYCARTRRLVPGVY